MGPTWQEVLFPAVTVRAESRLFGDRLLQTPLDDFKFDCFQEAGWECPYEVLPIKEDMQESLTLSQQRSQHAV